ncbi:MAG: hypothetical protein ACXW3J_09000, partial [Methylocystis sp.]
DATAGDLVAALKITGVELSIAKSADILTSALDLNGCVAARTDIGCAAPDEVVAMADQLAAAARERREQVTKLRMRRKGAIDALLAEARAFIGGAA